MSDPIALTDDIVLSDGIALPFAPEAHEGTGHLPAGPASEAWRRFDLLVVLVFLTGLLVPGGLLLAGRHAAAIENRPLIAMPVFSVAGALDGTYTAGLDAYLADNVPVRPYAIRLRGEAEWRSGGSGNPEVIRGRDGWLFIRSEFDPGCRVAGADQLASLQAAADRFAAAGQVFRYVAVPDKHTIYPEKVAADPFPASCTELGRADVRVGLSRLGPVAIDGWTVLEAARSTHPSGPLLYYPLDSHWTPRGAIEVIAALVRSIDPALWDPADVHAGPARSRGDLAILMGVGRHDPEPRVVVRPGVIVTRTDLDVPVAIRNARSVFRTTAVGDRRLVAGRTLVIYDSFFGIDVSLVAPYFADATWVHGGDLQEHPELAGVFGRFDTIVFERVDRGFYGAELGPMLAPLVR
jgi:hypothetical protein